MFAPFIGKCPTRGNDSSLQGIDLISKERKEKCNWKAVGDLNMPDTYEGDCGIVWSFIEGGLSDNDCKYCPRCGGSIVETVETPVSEPSE